MIIITISGPQGDGKTEMAKQLQNWLIHSRKVVKRFAEGQEPDPLPDNCDVVIIEKQTR